MTTCAINTSKGIFALMVLGPLWASGAVGCDDSPPEGEPTTTAAQSSSSGAGGGSSAATTGSGGDGGAGGDGDCFEGVPTTHDEIINACTDATRIEKAPVLPDPLPPIP